MPLCQSVSKFFSVRIGIAYYLSVAFFEGLARGSRRPQRIDAGAEVNNFSRVETSFPGPGIDGPSMLSIESGLYGRAIEISAKVVSERVAVTRHRTRASFNIPILTGARSSPR